MELFECLMGRRSIRKYKDKKIEREKLGIIIDAARWAPSAGNRQPWDIIVVENPETKKQIAEAALRQWWMESAPIFLVVCINRKLAESTYGKRGLELYAVQSTASAINNMLLAAYSEGLGTCWVGAFEEDKVGEILECEEHIRPIAIITLGYPDEKPKAPIRYEISDFTYTEKFGKQAEFKWEGLKKQKKKLDEKLRKTLEKF